MPAGVVQAMPRQGWRQQPRQMFSLAGLRDEDDLVWEGRESPVVEASRAVLLVLGASEPALLCFNLVLQRELIKLLILLARREEWVWQVGLALIGRGT